MTEPPKELPFDLPVWSRRWGHHDHYLIWHIPTGWRLQHLVHSGDCDPSGHPYLYANFDQDYIKRPPTIDIQMRSLWSEISGGKLSRDEIQSRLNAIGAEIEESERTPRTKSGKRRR